MADFEQALVRVLGHEGVVFDPSCLPVPGKTGYSDHPDDPGGETNYGIIKWVAREYGYTASMRDISFATVRDIYKQRYWDKMRGDDIPDQEIAEEMFDTGVNCGMGTVVRFLQRTLNVLNAKGTKYPDISADGAMGPMTSETLKKALAVAPYYRLCILRALDCLQGQRYIDLAERNEKLESFVAGWLRTRVGVKD